MVVGTVAFEQILSALRLLAQEHHSARRFGRSRRPGSSRSTTRGARRSGRCP
jgi:hypothetical protein